MDAARNAELGPTDLETKLRARGLRVTRPRVAVFRALERMGGHRSVDDVVDHLRDSGVPLSRMTVYNVVGDLERVSLIMRADAGPGRAVYEAGNRWHHHFVCRQCGKIIDVPCVVGSKPCLEQKAVGGVVDEAQVIFRGRCNECVNADGV